MYFNDTSIYEIRVKGVLDSRWSEWFDGMTLSNEASGETSLSGPVADQAALHGLLAKVRDLGLPLLSVHRRCPEHPGVDLESIIRRLSAAQAERRNAHE
jgi:hypothetical protein